MNTVVDYLPTRFWLMKTEPDVFAFEDLFVRKDRKELWDGVRNYTARNFMRDHMKVGDWVLVYHSNAAPPGVAGLARVVEQARPDPSAWDKHSKYFDPKSTKENPRWFAVTIGEPTRLERFVPLAELRENPKLQSMLLLRPGQRLSVQPLSEAEFNEVLKMVDQKKKGTNQ